MHLFPLHFLPCTAHQKGEPVRWGLVSVSIMNFGIASRFIFMRLDCAFFMSFTILVIDVLAFSNYGEILFCSLTFMVDCYRIYFTTGRLGRCKPAWTCQAQHRAWPRPVTAQAFYFSIFHTFWPGRSRFNATCNLPDPN